MSVYRWNSNCMFQSFLLRKSLSWKRLFKLISNLRMWRFVWWDVLSFSCHNILISKKTKMRQYWDVSSVLGLQLLFWPLLAPLTPSNWRNLNLKYWNLNTKKLNSLLKYLFPWSRIVCCLRESWQARPCQKSPRRSFSLLCNYSFRILFFSD